MSSSSPPESGATARTSKAGPQAQPAMTQTNAASPTGISTIEGDDTAGSASTYIFQKNMINDGLLCCKDVLHRDTAAFL